MVRATWMADRQSPGLLGCVGGSEWHRHDGQMMGRRVSAVRAGVREPVAEVW